MKTAVPFLLLVLAGLSACETKKDKKQTTSDTLVHTDTLNLPRTGELYEQTPEQMQEQIEQEIADSLNRDKTLKLALKIASQHKGDAKFNLDSDTLNIRYGFLFSPFQKHLMVHRTLNYGVYVDVYLLAENEFVTVLSNDVAEMAFIDDLIRDVNGDGRTDYLLHWYPMSGCCPRDVYNVYPQRQNGTFAEQVEFINPVFSPKEKVVRGICYGHYPPFYKYRWNGYRMDTVEYIYHDTSSPPRYTRRKTEDENAPGVALKELPPEYDGIWDALESEDPFKK